MEYSVFLPGNEKPEVIALLIGLTGFRSDDVIDALTKHLVKGMNETAAAAMCGVDESNFRRALAKLESKARVVEQIKDLTWPARKVTKLNQVT